MTELDEGAQIACRTLCDQHLGSLARPLARTQSGSELTVLSSQLPARGLQLVARSSQLVELDRILACLSLISHQEDSLTSGLGENIGALSWSRSRKSVN